MPDVPSHPERFTPQTAPTTIEDLRARLRATRWPDAPEDAGWSLGTDLDYLRELVAYWAEGSTGRPRRRRSPGSPASASRSAASASTSCMPGPSRRPGPPCR